MKNKSFFFIITLILISCIIMFLSGIVCHNLKSNNKILHNKILEIQRQQEDINRFTYLNNLDNYEINISVIDSLKGMCMFIVISDLNCSLCLSKFMKQLIELQSVLNLKHSKILLLHSSRDILYKYKRLYDIKIPMLLANSPQLENLFKEINAPFIFVSDDSHKIMHLFTSENSKFINSYIDIMNDRYFNNIN